MRRLKSKSIMADILEEVYTITELIVTPEDTLLDEV